MDAVSPQWMDLASELRLRIEPALIHHATVYLTLTGEIEARHLELQLAPQGRSRWLGELPDSTLQQTLYLLGWVREEHWTDGALRLEIKLRARVPRDLKIRHETTLSEALKYIGLDDLRTGERALDQTLLIQAREESGARALISHPSVLEALQLFQRFSVPSQLDSSKLVLYHRVHTVAVAREMIDAALLIVSSIEDAVDAPWRAVAEARGLQVGDYNELGYRTISGELEGAAIRVSVELRGRLRRREVLQITGHLTLPCRLTLGRSENDLPPVKTGNPIVDGMTTVYSDDVEWVRRVVAAAQNTGALMEVFSAYMDAEFKENRITMTMPVPLDPEALGARLDAIATLARAWGTG